MRLGVIDVGSNTVHLLVVDAHPGAHPWPVSSEKAVLRLAERLGPDGKLTEDGADALVEAVRAARSTAERARTDDLLAFATSAVREASNGSKVLERVRAEAGVDLQVLPGADEARLTFLAVRRWFGWSAGRLLVLDIGGGSLELAAGIDETPDVALSVPLGAGRLTRERLAGDPPTPEQVDALTDHVDKTLDEPLAPPPPPKRAGALPARGKRTRDEPLAALVEAGWDRPVATSKAFRSLARLSGAAPSSAGLRAPRRLTMTGLRQVLGFIRRIPSA